MIPVMRFTGTSTCTHLNDMLRALADVGMLAARAGAPMVLLVDDLVDSGETLLKVGEHLKQRYPAVTEVKNAVVWWKECSKVKPDYHVDYLPTNPWIHQPFEPYDNMRPAALLEKWKV